MKNISNDAFFSLIDTKTPEEFLVVKDLFNLHGKFNEKNSLELVTVLIVSHKQNMADKLADAGVFTIKKLFVSNNYSQFSGRQRYINVGMEKFISKHYRDEDKTI